MTRHKLCKITQDPPGRGQDNQMRNPKERTTDTMFDLSQVNRLCKISAYRPRSHRATRDLEMGIKIIRIKLTAKPNTGITHQNLTCTDDKILYTHIISRCAKDCRSVDDIRSIMACPFVNTTTGEEGCAYDVAYDFKKNDKPDQGLLNRDRRDE